MPYTYALHVHRCVRHKQADDIDLRLARLEKGGKGENIEEKERKQCEIRQLTTFTSSARARALSLSVYAHMPIPNPKLNLQRNC